MLGYMSQTGGGGAERHVERLGGPRSKEHLTAHTMTTPDIQQLLRRHVYGTKAERAKIEEAMAGTLVTTELAKEAALRGLGFVKAGNIAEAKKAEAEVRKWWRKREKYRARLM